MNSVNSKNLTFIILFLVVLTIIFTYALVINHDSDIIYTDINELEIED